MSRSLILVAALFGLLFSAAGRANEGPAPKSVEGIAFTPVGADIAQLLNDLEDPSFTTRQAASRRLADLGADAIDELEAAATAGSRESSSRALAVLKRHFEAGDATSQSSARSALERLAAHRDASMAQRARDILNPPQAVAATRPVALPGAANNFRAVFAGNGQGVRRVSVSDVNGRKTLEIDDRERTVKLETGPAGQIAAQIIDKQNPNASRKLDAADVADLRRKDAELARLYEQYAVLRAAGGAAGLGGAAPPIANRAAVIQSQLRSLDTILNRYRQRAPTDLSAQRMVEALEQTKAQLQAQAR